MKKLLLLISILVSSLGFSQADFSSAQTVNLQVDGTVTVNSAGVTGTAPSKVCNGYPATDVTAGAWYKFTPSQDLLVTVNEGIPQANSDYFSSFSVFTGTASNLTCVSNALLSTNKAGNLVPTEANFSASAGTTYYVVFDNYYANVPAPNGPIGTTAAFDFDVSTISSPSAPAAVTNPDPADGSTVFLTDTGDTDTNGNPIYEYVFEWDLPASSSPVTTYTFDLGGDNTVSAFSTDVNGASITLTGLQLDATYFWRITSNNPGGNTQGSVYTFTTEATLSADDFEEVEAVSFEFFVNNGLLTISANESFNQINIFDLSGKQIMDKELSSNDENISIQSLANGLYLAKVQIGEQTKTFKFLK